MSTVVARDLDGGRFEVDEARDYRFDQVTARGVDFSDVRFGRKDGVGGLLVNGCLFEDCDFSKAAFHSAQLGWRRTVYRRCTFDGASLRQIVGMNSALFMAFSLGEARFEECRFVDAKIRGWLAHDAEFVGCLFRGTIDRCRFFGTQNYRRWFGLRPPRRNEYRGNDFRDVEFIWSSFEDGIPIDDQLWPEGPEYARIDRVAERVARVHPLVATWPEGERPEAELVLELLAETAAGQDEVFERRSEPGMEPEVAAINERVWALLEQAL